MPELTRSRTIARAPKEIWAFVHDYANWAPLLPGYVSHDVESETDSLWTLRGDLGPFSREVKLRVQITEQTAPARVAFEMVGVGEPATGGGAFDLVAGAAPQVTWWQRLWRWITRTPPPSPADCEIRFTFAIDAGGPMAPMINALLAPYAAQVAQTLLERVAERLEVA